jgi:hypothetical protein
LAGFATGDPGYPSGVPAAEQPERVDQMSTFIEAIDPLPNGVQIGMRIPVVLLGLLGLVLALVAARRLGGLAAALGAAGAAALAVDQIVNIWWVLQISSLNDNSDTTVDDYNKVNNIFLVVDLILVAAGLLLLLLAFLVRRPAERGAAPATAAPPYGTPAYMPPAAAQFGGPGAGQPGGYPPPGSNPQPGPPGYPPPTNW